MKIKDFLSLEHQKIDHLSGKDKADALLKSVLHELTIGGTEKSCTKNKSSDDIEHILTMADYRSGLYVAMQFLEYYIDSGNFNLIPMPYPDTKEEKERINEIKADLERILK